MQGRAMGGLPVGLLELYDPDSILLSADEIQAEDSNNFDMGVELGWKRKGCWVKPNWPAFAGDDEAISRRARMSGSTALDTALNARFLFQIRVFTAIPLIIGTFSNIARTDIGDNFDCELLHISIWNCVQTPSHRKEHITCEKNPEEI
ncbi:Callose synthase 10, partial [Cucurbita argyrosperma subsp. argyrosperma]